MHRREEERPVGSARARGPRPSCGTTCGRTRRRWRAPMWYATWSGSDVAGELGVDLGHRLLLQQCFDRGRAPRRCSARWCRPRSSPSACAQRAVGAGAVVGGRARAIAASISSTSPPASATRRSARTRGDAVRYSFSTRVGEHDRCRCRDPRSPHRRARRPTPAGGRRSSARTPLLAATALTAARDLGRADLDGRRRRRRRTRRASPTSSVTARGRARRPRSTSSTVDAAAHRRERDRAVHRAGVEVLEAEPARRAPGRWCSCPLRPGRRWR